MIKAVLQGRYLSSVTMLVFCCRNHGKHEVTCVPSGAVASTEVKQRLQDFVLKKQRDAATRNSPPQFRHWYVTFSVSMLPKCVCVLDMQTGRDDVGGMIHIFGLNITQVEAIYPAYYSQGLRFTFLLLLYHQQVDL